MHRVLVIDFLDGAHIEITGHTNLKVDEMWTAIGFSDETVIVVRTSACQRITDKYYRLVDNEKQS